MDESTSRQPRCAFGEGDYYSEQLTKTFLMWVLLASVKFHVSTTHEKTVSARIIAALNGIS